MGREAVHPRAAASAAAGHKKESEAGRRIRPVGVPDKLRKRAKYYRAAYLVAVAGCCAMALTTPRNVALLPDGGLRQECILRLAAALLACLVSYFCVQGSNPGYIEVGHSGAAILGGGGGEMVEISLQDSAAEREERSLGPVALSAPQPSTERQRIVSFSSVGLRFLDEEDGGAKRRGRNQSDSDSDSDSDSSLGIGDSDEDEDDDWELDVEPRERADARLADVPLEAVPVRAKYCRNSKQFVATFDHFCGVLGTCIGERNHCRFWWFLLMHTGAISYLLWLSSTGFRDTEAHVSTWLNFNAHALTATVILSILLTMVGGLLLFHSFLACTSMTSYEFLRADRISYLRGTRDFDLPFSAGLCGNLHRFCVPAGWRPWSRAWEPREWVVPAINRESEDVWNHLWENKYWSCC